MLLSMNERIPSWLLPSLSVFRMVEPAGKARNVGDGVMLHMKPKRIRIDNNVFQDIAAAAAAHSVPYSTVCYWLRVGRASKVL